MVIGILIAVAFGYAFDRRQYQAYLDAKLPPDFDSKVKRRKQ
jgi:hypothetical protein